MTDQEIIKILTEKLEQALESKWINTNIQKAPANKCVDVWVDYQDVTGRFCNCFYNPKNNKFWYWNDDCSSKIQLYASHVTHWMPLPTAPMEV